MKYLKKWSVFVFVIILTGCAVNHRHHGSSSSSLLHQSDDRCDRIYSYDLNRQDYQRMDAILEQIAHATGCFIAYSDPKISAMTPHPVIGRMSIYQAVQTAIQGTPLKLSHPSSGELSLK